ncbi:MAG: alcohol dehydrogenase catalytic domain-containing protein [Candidatus Rokubacteria bacterium]|nr:alcohol dehydrogenase catalytic domain-containing protein [Candidatus Rokubacteria bacterium]
MRASFYEGAGRFRTGSAAVPAAGAGEALLKVRRVGICGTDLHIFQGHLDHRVPKGGIIGHETLAEVVEAPPGGGFAKGDRVVVEPLRVCNACRACRMGATWLCYKLKVLGVEMPGGMQEYWVVPTGCLIKVPAALPDDHAAVVEPLAIAVHAVTRANVKRDDAVLVFGGGPIGALIALVCRHRGARVIVSEVNPYRVALLEGLGLEVVGPGVDVVKFANDWTGGDGVDVAFEVTGNAAAVRLMTDAVRVWGTISVVAIHAEPMAVKLYPMFARELTMQGTRLYARADWEEAIRLATSGAVPVGPLVSHKIPLEGLQEGMEQALRGGPVMKVLVDLTI